MDKELSSSLDSMIYQLDQISRYKDNMVETAKVYPPIHDLLVKLKKDDLGIMERNQELFTQNQDMRRWKDEVTRRINLLTKRRPSVALDEMDVLIDDIKFGRAEL